MSLIWYILKLLLPSVAVHELTELILPPSVERKLTSYPSLGGGQGGLDLPLPVPFNPSSRPVFFGSHPFAFFRLQNVAQCCVIFPFFSRFPPPWESRFPPPLLPPPVHLPPPFLPISRPLSPPPKPRVDFQNH